MEKLIEIKMEQIKKLIDDMDDVIFKLLLAPLEDKTEIVELAFILQRELTTASKILALIQKKLKSKGDGNGEEV